MSRRAIFQNPFTRGARKVEGSTIEHIFGDNVSPLELGSSGRSARSESSQPPPNHQVDSQLARCSDFLSMDTSASVNCGAVKAMESVVPGTVRASSPRVYQTVGVQTDPEEHFGNAVESRKGSLSKLKDAGKILMPPHLIRRVVQLLKNGRTLAQSREHRQQAATPQVPPSRGSAPPRPQRPESLDLEFLELLGQYQIVNKDGLPGDIPVQVFEQAPPVAPGPFAKNVVVFPKLPDPVPVSVQPEMVPVPAHSTPREPKVQNPPRSPHKATTALGRRLGSISQSVAYWSVVQRNNLRVPSQPFSKWMTGGILGTGGFGRVYLVYNTALKTECAMKVVHYTRGVSESACRGIINEIKALSVLGSAREPAPFLLQPLFQGELWAWLSSPGYLHILTDVCTGGDLSLYRRGLPVDRLSLVCAEMILGLSHLHRNAIVHHDLKPHNVLVNAVGHCVIADYGGVRFLNRRGTLTRDNDTVAIMTTAFAAPELLANLEDGEIMEYDEMVDYWSLGATVVSMIMEDEYLPGTSDARFMQFRVQKIRSQMQKDKVSLDLQAFVMDLLQTEPIMRPKYPGITEHVFFQNVNWDDVLAQKRPVVPTAQEAVTIAHGWVFDTPKVHRTRDPKVDFLEELEKSGIPLDFDDSFNVEQQHAAMVADISA